MSVITYRDWEPEMVERVIDLTGAQRRDAQAMWEAALGAIALSLLEGREVHLRGIGKFQFFYHSPRRLTTKILPNGAVMPAMTTKGTYTLRFRTSNDFRTKLTNVLPKNPIMPKPINKGTFKVQAALKAAQETTP